WIVTQIVNEPKRGRLWREYCLIWTKRLPENEEKPQIPKPKTQRNSKGPVSRVEGRRWRFPKNLARLVRRSLGAQRGSYGWPTSVRPGRAHCAVRGGRCALLEENPT